MMSMIEAKCPVCGSPLEPRIFDVNTMAGSESAPGSPPAFLVGLFLWCVACDYMEQQK